MRASSRNNCEQMQERRHITILLLLILLITRSGQGGQMNAIENPSIRYEPFHHDLYNRNIRESLNQPTGLVHIKLYNSSDSIGHIECCVWRSCSLQSNIQPSQPIFPWVEVVVVVYNTNPIGCVNHLTLLSDVWMICVCVCVCSRVCLWNMKSYFHSLLLTLIKINKQNLLDCVRTANIIHLFLRILLDGPLSSVCRNA